jgi:hypothetical protein
LGHVAQNLLLVQKLQEKKQRTLYVLMKINLRIGVKPALILCLTLDVIIGVEIDLGG